MAQLSLDELDRLTMELASFSRAGIPMPEGLRQLERSLGSGRLRGVTGHLATELERGVSLSEALESSPVQVPPEYAAVLRCAEVSGDIRPILDFAVEHSRNMRRHRSALATTLVYPALVVTILLVSFGFALVVIVPKFKDIYDQLGAELPFMTQMFVNLSNTLAYSPLAHLVILLVLAGVVFMVLPPFRNQAYRTLSRLPGFSVLTALSDTAVFMKFLAYMTSRGVPMHESLRAASLAMWQPRTSAMLRAMAGAAEGGHPVAVHLGGKIPATAAWLFNQAEQRGTIPEACDGIATYCEDRFDRLSKRALAIIEPGLLLIVALIVGYMVIALYLPLFNIPKIIGR